MNYYAKLRKTKRAMTLSAIVALASITGILGVAFFANSTDNAEQSQASQLNQEELTDKTIVRAVNNSDNQDFEGLNSRAQTCSPDVVGVVQWGEEGELIEQEGVVDTCIGRTLTWYHIRWESGIEGWSISDFLEFENPEE